MTGTPAVLTRAEGAVSWIVLNRPERLNAFAADMRDQLAEAVLSAGRRHSTRVIVLTGAGRAFCAGADLDAMAELAGQRDYHAFSALVQAGTRVVRAIRAVPQPVLAAVNGVAAGAGASLAAACDYRLAAAGASIGFTFNRVGLHPDWGATYFLPRLVGLGRATELILSARMVQAEEAHALGLFERVTAGNDFDGQVAAAARELAAKPRLALSLAKRTLHGNGPSPALEEALRQEVEAQLRCFASDDVREGIAAFRGRRAPVFSPDPPEGLP